MKDHKRPIVEADGFWRVDRSRVRNTVLIEPKTRNCKMQLRQELAPTLCGQNVHLAIRADSVWAHASTWLWLYFQNVYYRMELETYSKLTS